MTREEKENGLKEIEKIKRMLEEKGVGKQKEEGKKRRGSAEAGEVRKREAPSGSGEESRRRNLIGDIVSFYHKRLFSNEGAIGFLKERGLKDKGIVEMLKVGYCEGELMSRLAEEGELVSLVQSLGIIQDGREYFTSCITIPIHDVNEEIIGIAGYSIHKEESRPVYLYFREGVEKMYHGEVMKRYDEIIVTTEIMECLSLIRIGVENVVAIGEEDLLDGWVVGRMKEENIKRVYVGFEGGGSSVFGEYLEEEGIRAGYVYPRNARRWNEYLRGGGVREHVESLVEEARRYVEKRKETEVYEREGGIEVRIEGVRYRVSYSGEDFRDSLRVGVKAEYREKRYYDSINIYSARSRMGFAKECGRLFEVVESVIEEHLITILEKIEQKRDERVRARAAKAAQVHILTPDQKKKYLDMVCGDDLLREHLLKDMEVLGVVGEETNLKVCYLGIISRHIARPLCILLLARSGTGKSYVQDRMMDLVPEESLRRYSRITPNVLFYDSRGFCGKVLSIDELVGMNESLYAIRSLISQGYLALHYTQIDPSTGDHEAKEKRTEGSPAVFCTGTSDEWLDWETKSRFLILSTDESASQDVRIMKRQRYELTLESKIAGRERGHILKKHRNILRLIEPVEVVMPRGWAEKLHYRGGSIMVRRENRSYLSLIESVAVMNQHKRKRQRTTDRYGGKLEYIEIEREDIREANALMTSIMGREPSDIDPPVREFLLMIERYCKEKVRGGKVSVYEVKWSRKEIREYSSFTPWQVNHYLGILLDMEYVSMAGRGARNLKYYTLNYVSRDEGERHMGGLVDPEEL